MTDDPIVDEVRQAREAYAGQFGYDIDAMCADLRRLSEERGVKPVSCPPRRPESSAEAAKRAG